MDKSGEDIPLSIDMNLIRRLPRYIGVRQLIALSAVVFSTVAAISGGVRYYHDSTDDVVFWTNAVRREPSTKNYLFLGYALRDRDKFQESEACFYKAHILAPENHEAEFQLGDFAARRGDYNQAGIYWQHVADTSGSSKGHMSEAWHEKALAKLQLLRSQTGEGSHLNVARTR